MRARLATVAAIIALSAGCGQTPEPTPTQQTSPSATVQTTKSSAAVSTSGAGHSNAFVAKRVALDDHAMGTTVSIATFTTPTLSEEQIRPKLQKALDEIRRLQALMTTWSETSEVSQVNAAAGKQAVVVGSETFAVIQKSIWAGNVSEGVFDITFEAMKGLWKFDEGAEDKIPSKEAIEKARKLIDYKQITIDEKARSVKLNKPQMRMNLGGIAKGYAIDAAARVLVSEGITSFFAQAGGDLYIAGKKPDGSRFKVGIRDPRGSGPTDYFALIEVEDHAFSTAGDYERAFVKDQKRYHHIIDPRTGYPANACRSVTVWAKDAFMADAVDDAIFILGPEKGLALIESIEDAGAVIVDAKNKVWVSKRLDGKVKMLRNPTDGT
ncbi:MAG: FAD:protein FMN transferase [Polyangiaceae bacterium]|nr:FAD:protein FMN transferase [Polyangiaceae bacterium]